MHIDGSSDLIGQGRVCTWCHFLCTTSLLEHMTKESGSELVVSTASTLFGALNLDVCGEFFKLSDLRMQHRRRSPGGLLHIHLPSSVSLANTVFPPCHQYSSRICHGPLLRILCQTS